LFLGIILRDREKSLRVVELSVPTHLLVNQYWRWI